MQIKILGNGGAINDGLRYNSFIIDDSFLVELPPDIMFSLFAENIQIDSIENIYISHLHGDHCFGFPFFALRQFVNNNIDSVKLIGPEGIENHLINMTILAFGETHPAVNWIKKHYEFIEINNLNPITINSTISIHPIEMFHLVTTYGFIIKSPGTNFAYFADSIWNNKLNEYIGHEKFTIIADLNGERNEEHPVHMSERDIVDYALPNINKESIFWGTHLKKMKTSSNNRIKYVKPGDVLEIK